MLARFRVCAGQHSPAAERTGLVRALFKHECEHCLRVGHVLQCDRYDLSDFVPGGELLPDRECDRADTVRAGRLLQHGRHVAAARVRARAVLRDRLVGAERVRRGKLLSDRCPAARLQSKQLVPGKFDRAIRLRARVFLRHARHQAALFGGLLLRNERATDWHPWCGGISCYSSPWFHAPLVRLAHTFAFSLFGRRSFNHQHSSRPSFRDRPTPRVSLSTAVDNTCTTCSRAA